jgi:hypothetical protein
MMKRLENDMCIKSEYPSACELHQSTFLSTFTYNYIIYEVENLYDTNFDTPDAHFDYLSLFSGTQAEKVGNPESCENYDRSGR